MWFAGIVNKYVLGEFDIKRNKKKWNLLDNNFNLKKEEEGNGMFIQEININKEFLA